VTRSSTATSLLEVADPATWDELAAVVPLDQHTVEVLSPRQRRVDAAFGREAVPALGARGVAVLVRFARRTQGELDGAAPEIEQRVAGLSHRARRLLHTAQRHAIDGRVLTTAFEPSSEGPTLGRGDPAPLRELLGAGLLERHGAEDDPDDAVRVLLHPDLPPPPEIGYDFDEAVMDAPDDLEPPTAGPVALLHDLAALAAAIDAERPKRTLQGSLMTADTRRLARRLAVPIDGRLEDDPRWGRALRSLEALGVVSADFVSRELTLDLGLEQVLAGSTEDAIDRLIQRLVEPDLRPAIPAVRAALRQAGEGAVDDVVFLDLLFEQHRDVLFTPWEGGVEQTYPGEGSRAFDREGFDRIEAPLVRRLLKRLARLGVVQLAPGVFAATADGRRWARAVGQPLPPVWVSSDLEVVVPPDGLTPWERFQLERLGRCIGRDVVDRYRLDREALAGWLRVHTVDEALELLARRSPALPSTAAETLRAWARSASRVVLTHGA
jgi:hypothetical protein